MSKELYYEGMIGFLKTQGCTEENFLAELTRGETTKEEYIEHLNRCVINNRKSDLFHSEDTFLFIRSIKGMYFWGLAQGALFNLKGTLKEKLLSFTSPKVTNEEIFVLFLKKHRKFSLWVRRYGNFHSSTLNNLSYRQVLTLMPTGDLEFLSYKWDKLTKALHITGNLNGNLILKG